MNKLNKKIISFVLLFSICLLVNVSFAFEKDVSIVLGDGSYDLDYESKIGDSLVSDITPDLYNKYLNPNDPEIDAIFNERIEFIFNELGFNSYFMYGYTNADGNDYFSASFFNDTSINFGFYDNAGKRTFCLEASNNSQLYRLNKSTNGGFVSSAYVYTYNTNSKYYNRPTSQSLAYFITSPNLKVHNLVYSSEDNIYWDGSYYGTSSEEEPIMPTNSEIASAVQMFYNSIYQYSNAFDDFFVLYDSSTRLYTYVGHTRGNALGQVIVEPNGYYDGYKFDVQWWKFFLDEQEDAWNWQNISKYFNYYVYTSEGTVDTLKNIGYSNISGLLSDGPWATSTTIIVYSTTDYPVKYITFTEDSPEPNIQTGLIEGDQYTYDENLDITNNNYNPLENFITVNPTINILGNVDFSEINKVFEENKDILNIESASWLFVANNNFLEYFMGFLFILIVFLIISRILGG